MGQPRTCLHALLNMLQQGVDTGSGPQCLHDTPCLAELGYQLVYKLCAVHDTSAPTLRYLRTTYDFLYQQLRHLPFDQTDYSEWILRCEHFLALCCWHASESVLFMKVICGWRCGDSLLLFRV